MYKVYATKSFTFDAAHNLLRYEGKCAQLHGHTYKLDVTVSRGIDTKDAEEEVAQEVMVMDFSDMKKLVNEVIISQYDHAYLNDYFPNPTAEAMIVHIFYGIETALPKSVSLHSVKLWETADSFVEYKGEVVW